MIKKVFLWLSCLLVLSMHVQAQADKRIEVFDIQKGMVVKRQELNPSVQKEAENYIKGITGVYTKVQPIPRKGFMVKIPLEPSVRIENEWLHDLVDEVIVIFPADESPYLMLYDNENRLHFFTFTGSADELRQILEL
ncbi:MAG TPA: hypothetical protein VIG80_12840 [Bacillaceae bacterium]